MNVASWRQSHSRLVAIAVLVQSLASGWQCGLPSACAQPGMTRIEGKFIDVVTDLPITDEIRELPRVFELAMPTWCQVFQVEPARVADWHAEVCIMLERERFVDAGLLPTELPDFPYGFQYGDRMWVSEQPSAYYRRHLLLHEGTHWFMNRLFGASGPPWLMEGMAEWLGTHHWDRSRQELQLGYFPSSKQEVPYWGRLTRIQKQLAEEHAPSLESILRYSNTAHREVNAYAWSWAAVVFLRHHPRTQAAFAELLKQPMRADAEMTRWFYSRLQAEWPSLREEWRATVTDFEYGFAPDSGFLELSTATQPLSDQAARLQLRSDRSWQPSGLQVTQGQSVQLSAEGMYEVVQQPEPWPCTADGVTLEYHRGIPWGRLLVTIAHARSAEAGRTEPLRQFAVGAQGSFTAWTSGELHFRVNEPTGQLLDNRGALQLSLSATPLAAAQDRD